MPFKPRKKRRRCWACIYGIYMQSGIRSGAYHCTFPKDKHIWTLKTFEEAEKCVNFKEIELDDDKPVKKSDPSILEYLTKKVEI